MVFTMFPLVCTEVLIQEAKLHNIGNIFGQNELKNQTWHFSKWKLSYSQKQQQQQCSKSTQTVMFNKNKLQISSSIYAAVRYYTSKIENRCNSTKEPSLHKIYFFKERQLILPLPLSLAWFQQAEDPCYCQLVMYPLSVIRLFLLYDENTHTGFCKQINKTQIWF